jgi:RNA-binding protein YhbY
VKEVIQKTNSDIIRTIGKTFIIYRESNVLEDEEKINLPK